MNTHLGHVQTWPRRDAWLGIALAYSQRNASEHKTSSRELELKGHRLVFIFREY